MKNQSTCLTSLDPEREYKVAPGQDKDPKFVLMEKDSDVKSYPWLHPTGKYGLNHPREKSLSIQKYFGQRLLNVDDRFSKDVSYGFWAQYLIERNAINSQISFAGQKGTSENLDTGKKRVHLKDLFQIFKQVPGTPKYWKSAKNELIAKVKQLGPFHLFFTLSCGESRWFEVFTSILKRKGYDVIYDEEDGFWNGSEDFIFVNSSDNGLVKLWEFVDSMEESKSELLQEFIFLVTRHFDERVKSFLQNILMAPKHDDKKEVQIEYYNYRVEFQLRGM